MKLEINEKQIFFNDPINKTAILLKYRKLNKEEEEYVKKMKEVHGYIQADLILLRENFMRKKATVTDNLGNKVHKVINNGEVFDIWEYFKILEVKEFERIKKDVN